MPSEAVEQAGDGKTQPHRLRGLAMRLRQRQAPLQDLQEISRALAPFIEARQGIERRYVLRFLVEDGVIAGDGLGRVTELALIELRDAPHEIAPRGRLRGREIEAAAQDVDQLGPLALRAVQLLQRIERA